MRAWGIVVACTCAVAAPLAVPAAGAATERPSPRVEIQRPNIEAGAIFGGSHGYLVGLRFPQPGIAILTALNFSLRDPTTPFKLARYAVRTRPTLRHGRIEVRFGDVARASLRFVPKSRHRAAPERGCRGRRAVTEEGTFRGMIEVAGEGGYTRASLRRVGGELSRSFELSCKPGRADNPDPRLTSYLISEPLFFGRSSARLQAISDAGGRTVAVEANHSEREGPGAKLEASSYEWDGGMLIYRSVSVQGGAGTLLTSLPGVHPATATLKPPAPFRGEASFLARTPTSNAWSGSLAVRLPGLDVPLTGPGFATSLCVVSQIKHPAGCTFDPKPVLPERPLRRIGRLR